jgi:hypothetical protein
MTTTIVCLFLFIAHDIAVKVIDQYNTRGTHKNAAEAAIDASMDVYDKTRLI